MPTCLGISSFGATDLPKLPLKLALLYFRKFSRRAQETDVHVQAERVRVINPLHPNIGMHIPHTVLYTFPYGADKENLFVNQKVSSLVTISFILTALMCDSGVML